MVYSYYFCYCFFRVLIFYEIDKYNCSKGKYIYLKGYIIIDNVFFLLLLYRYFFFEKNTYIENI